MPMLARRASGRSLQTAASDTIHPDYEHDRTTRLTAKGLDAHNPRDPTNNYLNTR